MLACGDALNWLQTTFEKKSVDLVITDPPYPSLEEHRAIGTTTRLTTRDPSHERWFPTVDYDYLGKIAVELYRVLRTGSHCYVFADTKAMFAMVPIFEAAGFKFWKPLVWDKVRLGMGYHYRCSYEFILFFEKGKRPLNSKAVRDVLAFEAKHPAKAMPAEKPVELARVLVNQSSARGELVIDPFMGKACPVGVAAIEEGRQFMGCDVMWQAVDRSKKLVWDAMQLRNIQPELPLGAEATNDEVGPTG